MISPIPGQLGTAMRRVLPMLGVVLIGLALAVLFARCSGNEGGPRSGKGGWAGAKDRPVPVVTEAVRQGRIAVYLNGIGTVTPRNSVTVRSRVDGELLRVAFQEGQGVQAGDLLAEIDPRPFQVQQLQAEGALARDRALLANARVDLERYRTLYQQDSGSKQQWDTQKALVEQYEGAIKTDLAQIESAKLQLVYARIVAPIGGRVGLRQVDPGNIVHASDTGGIATINEVRPIAVLFTLPEKDLPAVRRRAASGERPPVDAFDRDMKSRLASGTLLTWDNQIDPTTGTIRLKAEFPNEDGALFPSQFVNVRLLVDQLDDATLVPAAAIQRGVQGTFVYVVGEDRTVAVRAVKLGPAEGDVVAAEEGLAPGERVVVDGADKLRDGAKVEIGGQRGEGAPPDAGRGGSGGPSERSQRRPPGA